MATLWRYSEDERAAFENGYRAAIQDVLVMESASARRGKCCARGNLNVLRCVFRASLQQGHELMVLERERERKLPLHHAYDVD